ncbi:MAG: SDR family NAD(P)-dependent oxidoreductase [Tannerella sp.]|jgi:rhamnose utilization protein RhaD (predicted bifunctional aldolase and dehydrogenase)/NAD(P)-dependent dehydrogenase (short-subunit alcohol dehydrogenase family)|nr:SDR family NAD(P)-dependent oxidoreductase [Tannerella sp.]
MNKSMEKLIEISRKYGNDSRYVIAGGGNTSFKDNSRIWVKASGHALATIDENGFSVLDRKLLNVISEKEYSKNTAIREDEVKNDLASATITKDRRPSVETSMHNAINYTYVVHLHPTLVNGLMCSNSAEKETAQLFGDEAVYIPYTEPGYTLFKEVEARIGDFKKEKGKHPTIILLQNHGIFVSANSTEEIEKIYDDVLSKIEKKAKINLNTTEWEIDDKAAQIIPAIRMIASRDGNLKTLKIRNNSLINKYSASKEEFSKIELPFTPDAIVYCKSKYIYLTFESIDSLLKNAEEEMEEYVKKNGYTPKIIVIKGIGVIAIGDNVKNCDIILDVFEDAVMIAETAQSFGGEHPLTKKQTDFIDNWEVENYRRRVIVGNVSRRVENKVIIVTGAAQGFGEGIAEYLINEGANIVVADLNEEAGKKTAERFSTLCKSNGVIFVKTNVTDAENLKNLVHQTVCNFGGIDVFINNAGVLKAGSITDMTPENFEFVTKINYNAYFYCTKAVVPVMKLQNVYNPDNYCDIIQINSKSGLRGSKANFAYAGGKFGGIGLTQSFALELAPFGIKVNSICPGNYYEGPLWANPENGLFRQYLEAGKVPGAKTIEDVRRYYMSQVPMNKGTSPADVTKAALYLIEQTCETGQALPVTGGQVMLN